MCFCPEFFAVTVTVKPRYSAPAYNEFPLIEHTNFGPKKYFHGYFYTGNSENLCLEHNFDRSLEMRYIGVPLYVKILHTPGATVYLITK